MGIRSQVSIRLKHSGVKPIISAPVPPTGLTSLEEKRFLSYPGKINRMSTAVYSTLRAGFNLVHPDLVSRDATPGEVRHLDIPLAVDDHRYIFHIAEFNKPLLSSKREKYLLVDIYDGSPETGEHIYAGSFYPIGGWMDHREMDGTPGFADEKGWWSYLYFVPTDEARVLFSRFVSYLEDSR
jgi:hypothetical protein